ncbi:hypothetical protein V6N12_076233 [Hibiscus sabdariffa]|uniref:Uncharacterized protein n=1 Tax=Hibiscus sabdariffa TaxID=183260 RepID=A0ABR2AZI1_9ROSI
MTSSSHTVVVQRENGDRSMDRHVARSIDEIRLAAARRVHCSGERGSLAWKLKRCEWEPLGWRVWQTC